VTYVVYTVRLTSASRADLVGFWRWVKARDAWFYKELPMVKSVRRYVTAVGDISTVEIWQEFEDLRAYAAYTEKVAELRRDPEWERRRVEQEQRWEFLGDRILSDAPLPSAS